MKLHYGDVPGQREHSRRPMQCLHPIIHQLPSWISGNLINATPQRNRIAEAVREPVLIAV